MNDIEEKMKDTSMPCTRCHGTGTIVCTTCNGRGKTEGGELCNACSGKGHITCPVCNGSGHNHINKFHNK